MRLTTEADLAEQFGLSVEKLRELRRRHRWPHVRLGRFDVRFTDAQVEQIVAQHSQTPEAAIAGPVKVPGQTARSAARRRSA
ncbi:hypothetical protein [Nocardioides terrisoli]|uniref:hypothetical protein n=1 Tax=Nocardioides terrisoli TaxID=3388267 RepID=UPI00287BB303|nr:hypothetical protein [Nocardioides marmorisolisilvae]